MNWIARIVMGLIGLVFLAFLLVALGMYIVFASLRWLITGRKPQVVLVWQQFGALRKRVYENGPGGRNYPGGHPGFGTGFESPNQADIVDVEVREVVDAPAQLPKN